MKIKQWQIGLVVVLGMALLALWIKVFWLTEIFTLSGHNEANRDAVVALHSAVPLADTRERVLQHYYRIRTDDLRLYVDNPEEWIVSMPLEPGASDWSLRIEFDDDRVSALRVRTSDGPQPKGSPEDKESHNIILEGIPKAASGSRKPSG